MFIRILLEPYELKIRDNFFVSLMIQSLFPLMLRDEGLTGELDIKYYCKVCVRNFVIASHVSFAGHFFGIKTAKNGLSKICVIIQQRQKAI